MKQRSHLQQATSLLRNLKPGQSTAVPILERQPARRMAQQALSHAAIGLWGPGWYTLETLPSPPRVIVTRLTAQKNGPRHWRPGLCRPAVAPPPNEWGVFAPWPQTAMSDLSRAKEIARKAVGP